MAYRTAESYDDKEFDAREAIIVDAQIEIHRILESKNITQAELARRMGVKSPYINRLISGPASNITLRTYASIMYHLGEEAHISVSSYVESIFSTKQDKSMSPHPSDESNVVYCNFSRKPDIKYTELNESFDFHMPVFEPYSAIRSHLQSGVA